MKSQLTVCLATCILLAYSYTSFSSFTSSFAGGGRRYSQLLFVLHDAGESLGLQPVIDFFLAGDSDISGNVSGVTTQILCLGEPSTSIYSLYPEALTLTDLGITDIEILDGTPEAREQLLSDEDLSQLQSQLYSSVVTCGMAYAMQAQICSSIFTSVGTEEKAYSMSFYDSFSLWSNTSVAATYFTNPTPELVQTVMVSADDQKDSLLSGPDAVSSSCSVSSTGNPTLQSWAAVDANVTKKRKTRELLYGPENDHVIGIIYAGGYGGADYDNSLDIFCSAALQLCLQESRCLNFHSSKDHGNHHSITSKDISGETQYAFVFSPHPGYTSAYEMKLFHEGGCLEYIRVLPEAFSIPSSQVIVSSNVSMSQCSTVGGQSLSVGIAHAYLTTTNGCEDVFTANNLIPIASTGAELNYLLMESESFRGPSDDYTVDPSVLIAAGVPLNGTENIVVEIESHLS